jgi:FdhD protein
MNNAEFDISKVVFIDKKDIESKNKELSGQKIDMPLINEKFTSIIINEKFYTALAHTPGFEIELAAGFCLYEGIIEKKEDIEKIILKKNKVFINIAKQKRDNISYILDKIYTYYDIDTKIKDIKKIKSSFKIDIKKSHKLLTNFSSFQDLHKKTRATHAIVIFDRNYEMISKSEDHGRHNAADKAIGSLFLKDTLKNAAIIVFSSRISHDLLIKAARAKIPNILALSRPTMKAVSIAKKLNITLMTLGKDDGMLVFTGLDQFTTLLA